MARRKSALLDTRVIYCGDNIDQLPKLPDKCVDLVYIDPPFNQNRSSEVFWGETKEKRAVADRTASHEEKHEGRRARAVEQRRGRQHEGGGQYTPSHNSSNARMKRHLEIPSSNEFEQLATRVPYSILRISFLCALCASVVRTPIKLKNG